MYEQYKNRSMGPSTDKNTDGTYRTTQVEVTKPKKLPPNQETNQDKKKG